MSNLKGILTSFVTLILSTFTGHIYAQNCLTDTIVETTPDTQYVVHGDGTITDTTTALMWKQCLEGLSGITCNSGIVDEQNWSGALQTPGNINTSGGYAGYADWRLPNVAELVSLVEEQCTSPAINEGVFPNTGNKFIWTGSPDYNNDQGSWSVDFNVGTTATLTRDQNYRVRLVRSVR